MSHGGFSDQRARATVLKTADNSFGDFYPIFMHTLFAGLVPPFSDFFLAVLERYQI